jgi:hypothetical protein
MTGDQLGGERYRVRSLREALTLANGSSGP